MAEPERNPGVGPRGREYYRLLSQSGLDGEKFLARLSKRKLMREAASFLWPSAWSNRRYCSARLASNTLKTPGPGLCARLFLCFSRIWRSA